MTVRELLSGVKRPLTNVEYIEWMAYFTVKAKLEKKERDKQKH